METPRFTLGPALLVLAITLSACSGPEPNSKTSAVAHPTAEVTTDTAQRLADIGHHLFELETEAVELAFGEPLSQTEGQEDRYHTLYSSSIAVLREAAHRDSSSAAAWYWLGRALASRAYRGFGEWDRGDQTEAVGALERATRLLGAGAPLLDSALAALARERSTLNAIPQE